jgi:UDP-glucose:(heptosyl)LPS alpha-1,3-glucosyltransferase
MLIAGSDAGEAGLQVAFGIVRLFPEGGLQRDCVRLARLLLDRGHQVTIFAAENRCELPPGLQLTLLPVRAATNHGRDWAFARKFAAAAAGRFDRVVGFNKLVGLDILYCADPPVEDRMRRFWRRALPRYRMRLKLERECFGQRSSTHIIALTQASVQSYRRHWGLGAERFTVIPPGIDFDRRHSELREPGRRAALRAALALPADRPVWLWVGAQTRIKGLDRAIAALAAKPDAVLLVAGVTATGRNGSRAATQARRLGAADRVRFLGYREDIPNLFAAADVLIHPARLDVTGQVILEAMVNGLPVVVSGCCGFAELVRAANAGIVLAEPFVQGELEAALARAAEPQLAAAFSRNGIDYGRSKVPQDGLTIAAEVIENSAKHNPDAGLTPSA